MRGSGGARDRASRPTSTEADEHDAREAAARIDALAEWRERYRSIQDGLAGLTDAQRICLMLQTAGVSYERIRRDHGLLAEEGRAVGARGAGAARAWEVRLASGRRASGSTR